MKTEDLKGFVLRMFGTREFYGYEVHKKLASVKINVGISRLYRVLTEMSQDGSLEGRWEKGRLGPRKRIYRLGRKGKKQRKKILLDAIETVHMFYSEYLLTLPAKLSVITSICRLLTSNVDRKGEIAFISPAYATIHEKILYDIHDEMPEAKIYFVKPARARAVRRHLRRRRNQHHTLRNQQSTYHLCHSAPHRPDSVLRKQVYVS